MLTHKGGVEGQEECPQNIAHVLLMWVFLTLKGNGVCAKMSYLDVYQSRPHNMEAV